MAVLLFSILGIIYDGYFYCLHFFHIIIGNDILLRATQVRRDLGCCESSRIPQSVTKNGKSLLWVAALMIVIIYVYSQSAFAWLRRDFVPQDNHLWCNTPWQCFIASLRSGLLNNLGSDSAPNSYHTFTEFAVRAVFFDISFWIIITTICLCSVRRPTCN